MKHMTKSTPKIRVRCRPQTDDQQRRCHLAVELLLTEWVRQRLTRERDSNEFESNKQS